jgi:tetratricopeptide (TPR) repeat protein
MTLSAPDDRAGTEPPLLATLEQEQAPWSRWRSCFLTLCAERRWSEAIELVQAMGRRWPQAAAVLEAALGVTLAAKVADASGPVLSRVEHAGAALPPVWQGLVRLAQEDYRGAQQLFEESARSVSLQTSPVVALLTRVGLGRVLLERSDTEPQLAQQAVAWYADALWMYGESSPGEWWRSYGYALAAAGKWVLATQVLSWRLAQECERIDQEDTDSNQFEYAQPHVETLLGLWVCLKALSASSKASLDQDALYQGAEKVARELLREAFVLYAEERRVRNAIAVEHPEWTYRFLETGQLKRQDGVPRKAQARSEYILGRWEEHRNDWIAAETRYGTSVQNWADMAPARLALAHSLLRRKELLQAMEQVEQVRHSASRLLSGQLDAHLRALSAVILQEQATTAENVPPSAITKANEEALLLLQDTDSEQLPPDALAVYAELTDRLDPVFALGLYSRLVKHWNDPVIWNNIAALNARLGQHRDAELALQRGLGLLTGDLNLSLKSWVPDASFFEKSPARLTVVYNLGRLLELRGETAQAEIIYRCIHERFPSYEDATLRLGVLTEQYTRDLSAAESYYRQVVPNPRAVTALAFLAQARGRVEEAQEWFEYFIRRKKLHKSLDIQYQARNYCDLITAAYYITLARATARHHQTRRHKFLIAAGNMLLGVLERSHDNVAAMLLLGVYFREWNLLTEAEEALSAVVQLGPVAAADSSIVECARANLIAVHLLRGASAPSSLRNVLRLVEEHLLAAPHDSAALVALAAAHFGLAQYRACLEALQRALHLQPTALSIWFDFALALAREARIRLDRLEYLADLQTGTRFLESAGGCFRAIEASLRNMKRSLSDDCYRRWQAGLAGPTNRVVSAEAAHANGSWCFRCLPEARERLAHAEERIRRKREELRQQQQLREAAVARQAEANRQRREAEQREAAELEKLAREQQLEFLRRQEEWEAQRGKSRRKSNIMVDLDEDLEEKPEPA